MWRILCERVKGTSHERSGVDCQDFIHASECAAGDDRILIAACADGAGSAEHSQVGSQLACSALVSAVARFLDAGHTPCEIEDGTVREWFRSVRADLQTRADESDLPLRQVACTLLLAVVSAEKSVFAQIGDGAIVYLDGLAYVPAFWPDSGEYHNSTYFLTDENFEDNLQVRSVGGTAEVAMFSDGLQMLALNYAQRMAHQPFFAPLFASLRSVPDHSTLVMPMRRFLSSDRVNARTDDDKSLLLAVRVPDAEATL
jgi:hypothetical protein